MTSLWNTMAFASFGVLAVSKVVAIVTYDSLLRHQFESHPNEWERDGSRRGMNWRPPSGESAFSFFGQAHAWMDWLFQTPEWALADTLALRMLSRFRVSESLATVAALSFGVALLAARAV